MAKGLNLADNSPTSVKMGDSSTTFLIQLTVNGNGVNVFPGDEFMSLTANQLMGG